MENKNSVTIKLNNDTSFVLESDTPNIVGFVNKIVEEKDKINVEKIEINASSENFDVEGFKNIIVQTINDFMEKVKINKNALEEITNELNNQISRIDED